MVCHQPDGFVAGCSSSLWGFYFPSRVKELTPFRDFTCFFPSPFSFFKNFVTLQQWRSYKQETPYFLLRYFCDDDADVDERERASEMRDWWVGNAVLNR